MSNINIAGHQNSMGSGHEDIKRKPLVWQKADENELQNEIYKDKPKPQVSNWVPKMHQQVWNDKEHQYESSFKSFVRNQQDKKHDQNWLGLNLYGDDKELVMTGDNYHHYLYLCLLAFIGGIIAGIIIRCMSRHFFPQVEEKRYSQFKESPKWKSSDLVWYRRIQGEYNVTHPHQI